MSQAGLHRGARGQEISGSARPQYTTLRAIVLSSFGLLANGDAEKLWRVLWGGGRARVHVLWEKGGRSWTWSEEEQAVGWYIINNCLKRSARQLQRWIQTPLGSGRWCRGSNDHRLGSFRAGGWTKPFLPRGQCSTGMGCPGTWAFCPCRFSRPR